MTFTRDELDGVSPDFLGRLATTEDGKLIVTTKNTDFLQVMENARRSETRRGMLEAYDRRAGDTNSLLLEEAITLRQQIAALVGVPSYASYRIAGRMAERAEAAIDLLTGLKSATSARLAKDLDLLKAAKRRELNDPNATLDAWDLPIIRIKSKKSDLQIDDEAIKEYFPKDRVMAGLFAVYSQILGVSYQEVVGAEVWILP